MVHVVDGMDDETSLIEAYKAGRGEAVHRLSLALAESADAGKAPRCGGWMRGCSALAMIGLTSRAHCAFRPKSKKERVNLNRWTRPVMKPFAIKIPKKVRQAHCALMPISASLE